MMSGANLAIAITITITNTSANTTNPNGSIGHARAPCTRTASQHAACDPMMVDKGFLL